MEVNLSVGTLKFSLLGSSTVVIFLTLIMSVLYDRVKIIMPYFPRQKENNFVNDSTLELFQKGNFSVVAAIAASIRSYKKSK